MSRTRQYIVRLTHTHEPFRRPELETIATTLGIKIDIVDYRPDSPFCVIEISHPASATRDKLATELIQRSILAKSIHELYATGSDYETLHEATRGLPLETWAAYRDVTFKFSMDVFCGKRTESDQRQIVERFSYLPLKGRVRMKKPDVEFVLLEEWQVLTPDEHSVLATVPDLQTWTGDADKAEIVARLRERRPRRVFLGRHIGDSRRELIVKHDLKKRPYISTTSMDAELALVTAVLAKAAPGKLFLDPFTGTGGFMVAASELGAVSLGTDIDGRSYRGKGRGIEKGVGANFVKYGIWDRFGDCLTSDLTNTPLRVPGRHCRAKARWLDGIVCDPPYGVREGLKVLGRRVNESKTGENATAPDEHQGPYFIDGVASHKLPGFIAPKRPYSFNRMLDDILEFAARTLVDHGRLAFWMPCANDSDEAFPIPQHSMLELKYNCVQAFNKWSRRLLVYDRIGGEMEDDMVGSARVHSNSAGTNGHSADALNQFRRLYFRGFLGPSSHVKKELGQT